MTTVPQYDLDRHLLDARAVADWLGVTPRWVEDNGRLGVLPSVRIGGKRRYRRSTLLAWLDAREESGRR